MTLLITCETRMLEGLARHVKNWRSPYPESWDREAAVEDLNRTIESRYALLNVDERMRNTSIDLHRICDPALPPLLRKKAITDRSAEFEVFADWLEENGAEDLAWMMRHRQESALRYRMITASDPSIVKMRGWDWSETTEPMSAWIYKAIDAYQLRDLF